MGKGSFLCMEQSCADTFRQLGQVYNINSPENHPLIFSCNEDFKAGMSILAVCAKMYRSVKIYAFQLMSNHVHMVAGGQEGDIKEFFEYYKDRLGKHFCQKSSLNSLSLRLFPIEDLTYFRNAVVYVNRNGFVVNDDCTPFSYPWGTSAFFFQPLAYRYIKECGAPIGNQAIRNLMHTKSCDVHKGLLTVDGYISPTEFCDIALAQRTFRDAKQYFYMISRNVENYSIIARSIGESIYLNDNDLFVAATKLAKEQFGTSDLQTLPANRKMEMAKRLHFDYNAGDKQLHRLLKIEPDILKALF